LFPFFLPHPNPPLVKGRGLDFPVSPLYKGGVRGVKNYNLILYKHPLGLGTRYIKKFNTQNLKCNTVT